MGSLAHLLLTELRRGRLVIRQHRTRLSSHGLGGGIFNGWLPRRSILHRLCRRRWQARIGRKWACMCFGGASLLPRVVAVADSDRILLGQVLSSLAWRGQNWSFAPRDRLSFLGSCCLLSLDTVSLLASASATISRYRCKLTLVERHLSRVIVVLVRQHRCYFSTTAAHFLTLRFLLRIRII